MSGNGVEPETLRFVNGRNRVWLQNDGWPQDIVVHENMWVKGRPENVRWDGQTLSVMVDNGMALYSLMRTPDKPKFHFGKLIRGEYHGVDPHVRQRAEQIERGTLV